MRRRGHGEDRENTSKICFGERMTFCAKRLMAANFHPNTHDDDAEADGQQQKIEANHISISFYYIIMSEFQLQLIPAHNEKAGRTLPLSLGRVELAKWFWHSCSCRRGTTRRNPCCQCQLVARKTHCLSKKIFYLTKNGSVSILTRKNRHLLWYNGEPMCKKSDSTAILLQPGDTISIGNSDTRPWLEFHVKRIPIPITPEAQHDDQVNMFRASTTTTLKSRKRLYYTYPSSGISADSSSEQLSFQDSQDGSSSNPVQVHTQSSCLQRDLAEQAATTTTRKRKHAVSMNPRRILEGKDVYVRVRNSNTKKKNPTNVQKDTLRRATDMGDSSSDFLGEDAWMTTRRQSSNGSRETQAEYHTSSSSDSSFPLSHVSKKARKDDPCLSQPQQVLPSSSTPESNETSVLSLPQCPSWNDDDDEKEYKETGGTNSGVEGVKHKSLFSRELINEATNEGPCLQVFGANATTCATRQSQDDSDSPAIQFASSLSLSEWKHMKQHSANSASGRVRHALASLVVAQRVRGDSTWFPKILEGAVVEEVESQS